MTEHCAQDLVCQFIASLDQYKMNITAVREADGHHDQRRQVFMTFLQAAFGIHVEDIEIEQYIQIKGQQVKNTGTARIRKGWIDAVFKDVIFEFKALDFIVPRL